MAHTVVAETKIVGRSILARCACETVPCDIVPALHIQGIFLCLCHPRLPIPARTSPRTAALPPSSQSVRGCDRPWRLRHQVHRESETCGVVRRAFLPANE